MHAAYSGVRMMDQRGTLVPRRCRTV